MIVNNTTTTTKHFHLKYQVNFIHSQFTYKKLKNNHLFKSSLKFNLLLCHVKNFYEIINKNFCFYTISYARTYAHTQSISERKEREIKYI